MKHARLYYIHLKEQAFLFRYYVSCFFMEKQLVFLRRFCDFSSCSFIHAFIDFIINMLASMSLRVFISLYILSFYHVVASTLLQQIVEEIFRNEKPTSQYNTNGSSVEMICHNLQNKLDLSRVACCTPSAVRHLYNVLIEDRNIVLYVDPKQKRHFEDKYVNQTTYEFSMPIELREGPFDEKKHCKSYFDGISFITLSTRQQSQSTTTNDNDSNCHNEHKGVTTPFNNKNALLFVKPNGERMKMLVYTRGNSGKGRTMQDEGLLVNALQSYGANVFLCCDFHSMSLELQLLHAYYDDVVRFNYYLLSLVLNNS